MRPLSHRPGFSMIEIIATISIILVLALILVPVGSRMKNQSKRTACMSNLRQIGIGLEGYLEDNNNIMPTILLSPDGEQIGKSLPETLADYVGDSDIFNCPADESIYESTGSSYFFNPLISNQHRLRLNFLGNSQNPESTPLVSDKEAFHGKKKGTNILYADYITTNEVRFRAGN